MSYLTENWNEVLQLSLDHIRLSGIAMALAIAIGVPLGILIARIKALSPFVIGVASVFYLIPSLALFAILVPYIGLGTKAAVVGLVLYAQLAIIRNTATGLLGVPPPVLQAATGLGMTKTQSLFLIELPLALPVIVAGVRVATVMTIGVATIAAYVGAGGLGSLVFQGLRLFYPEMVLAGALPVSIIAVTADLIFVGLERYLSRNLPTSEVGHQTAKPRLTAA